MNTKNTIKEFIRGRCESLLKIYFDSLPRIDFDPGKIDRILVFAYHGLGNFIMFTPALRLLRKRYPDARIDLQAGNNTGCEEVLAGAGLFDNIYNLPYSAGLRRWVRRAIEIRETRYDLTVNECNRHSSSLRLFID